uniref:Uncharacterized protein n=1 Tax=Setaria viridis TaxID=4556 RepID=A0A4U6TSN1_SETVI|nr:hypothetical protein SEVIR_7G151300v2 [Setaria viridis]
MQGKSWQSSKMLHFHEALSSCDRNSGGREGGKHNHKCHGNGSYWVQYPHRPGCCHGKKKAYWYTFGFCSCVGLYRTLVISLV